jgi:hypothetical protein
MSTLNGTPVVFAFTTAAGITITGMSGILLQSKDHAKEADRDVVRDGTGSRVQSSHYDFRDTATLRVKVTGSSLSDAKVQTSLKAPGTLLVVTACADDPDMVATNWEVQSGTKLIQTNTTSTEGNPNGKIRRHYGRFQLIVNEDVQDYFSRCIPEPYRILGLQLLPLSLGRYRLLKRFNCAFVADDEASAEFGDLLLGVIICSLRCDEFLELVNSRRLEREIRRWSRKICPHPWIGCLPWIGKWWRARHSFNFVEKAQLFQSYIRKAQIIPRYRILESNYNESSAHWSHGVEVCLRSEVGWSLEEICEQPLTKAIADYFKFCENKGLLSLMTAEDIAAPSLTQNMTPEQLKMLDQLPDPEAN